MIFEQYVARESKLFPLSKLKGDIKELIEAGVIDWETGDKISSYYQKKPQNYNRLLLAFGILAAILVGLGIILIIAHNWDNLSQLGKTCFAFLPLITSLCLVGFALWRKDESTVFKEVSGILLFFSIAAAIALIGQIYHVEGEFRSFLGTWLILGLPIVYLLPSSAVSILILLWLNGLSQSRGSGWHTNDGPLIPYDLLFIFLALLPYYYYLIRTISKGNFTLVHHWLITFVACSIVILQVGMMGPIGILSVLIFFGLLYGIGKSDFLEQQRLRWNPYLLVGALGTVATLFVASFLSYWNFWQDPDKTANFYLPHDYIIILLFMGALYFLYKSYEAGSLRNLNPISISFLIFIPIYFIGEHYGLAGMILTNILLSTIGLYYIIYGHKMERLAILNFGMVILSGLIIFRFFEIDLSFVGRGICFVLIGLAFFMTNYFLIKKSNSS